MAGLLDGSEVTCLAVGCRLASGARTNIECVWLVGCYVMRGSCSYRRIFGGRRGLRIVMVVTGAMKRSLLWVNIMSKNWIVHNLMQLLLSIAAHSVSVKGGVEVGRHV